MRTLRIVWVLLTLVGLLVVSERLRPAPAAVQAVPAESIAIPVNERQNLTISRLKVRETKSAAGVRQIVVWGMVENGTPYPVDRLNLLVAVKNGLDPAATSIGRPAVAALPAGGSSPFKMTLTAPAGWAPSWSLNVEASGLTTDKPIAALAVEDVSTSVTNDRKILVRGSIHNTTAWPTAEVQVWAVLLDQAGEVLTGQWLTVGGLMEPDGRAPVEVVFGATNGWSRVEIGALDRLMH